MQTQWNDQPHYLPQEQQASPQAQIRRESAPPGKPPAATPGGPGSWPRPLSTIPIDRLICFTNRRLDVLALIDEALALLSPALRWQVTFNTHFTELPAHLSCAWRCCAAGSAAISAVAGRSGHRSDASAGKTSVKPLRAIRATGQAAAEFASAEPTPIIEAALPEISAQAPPYGDEPQHDYPAFPRQPVTPIGGRASPPGPAAVVWPAIVLGIIALICIGFWINQKLHPPLESALPELTALAIA